MILSAPMWRLAALIVAVVLVPSCVCRTKTEKRGADGTESGGVQSKELVATRPTAVAVGVASAAAGRSLFDGKTLEPWRAVDFGGSGEPSVEDGCIILPTGERLTGVTWHGEELPRTNYEISLEAKRVDGTDFFCGLTFPVADSYASLIVGGWGGALCGISSLDGDDAMHNSTKTYQEFENGKWYRIRMRVTPTKLETWLEDKKIVDVVITGKKVGVRPEMEDSKPMALASFASTAAIRNIRLVELGKSATRPVR